MHKKFRWTNYSLFVSAIAALGGLLYGYNTSVISGPLLFIAKQFQLTIFEQEVIVSTIIIGALIGAFLGGFLTDHLGRKKTLFFTIALFVIGIGFLTEGDSFTTLLVGRMITGLGIGVISMASPLYIAEMSPPKRRGSHVSLYQLAITIGILMGYVVSYHYAEEQEWRPSFGFAFIPLAIQFLGLFFIPETPSWLLSHNRKAAADKVLHQLRAADPDQNLVRVEEAQDPPTNKSWRELLNPRFRKAFLIGIGVSVFQQITGINTVIYYAPQIFQQAGYQTAQTAIFATVLIGIVNVAATIFALWIVDRLGRRVILITGLIGMSGSLALLGYSFISGGASGFTSIIGLMIYVSFFAISLGPVTWLIISEIYPLGIRGRAMGIAIFANWVSNYFVSLTYLSLIESLGTGLTFWLYTVICLLGLWFVYKLVPETKDKTFEEIQNFWKK